LKMFRSFAFAPFFYGSIAEAAFFIVARSALQHPRFLPRF
jgi:hypothetical protein